MAYFRLIDVARQFLDDDGAPLSGGKLYTYEAGTVTNKAAFEDSGGIAAHTNPIILDSSGRVPAEVFGTTGAYKLRLDDPDDVTLWTRDNITGINDSAAVEFSEWVTSPLTPTYVGATSFTLPGDQTTEFHPGRRLRTVDGSGTDYSTIVSSVYSDPATTVTIANDAGVIDAGLSSVAYGFGSAVNTSIPFRTLLAARATLSANQSSFPENTPTKIAFNTATLNIGGHFDTTGNGYVVPVTGRYLVTGAVSLNTQIADGSILSALIYVDPLGAGSPAQARKGATVTAGAAGSATNAIVAAQLSLTATDIVYLYATVGDFVGGTTGAIVSTGSATFLEISRIA